MAHPGSSDLPSTAAGPISTGEDPTKLHPHVVIATTITTVAAGIVLVLKLTCRYKLLKRLKLDDYVVLLAFICSVAVSALLIERKHTHNPVLKPSVAIVFVQQQ